MTWRLHGTKEVNLNISLKEWLDVTIFFLKGPFWPKTSEVGLKPKALTSSLAKKQMVNMNNQIKKI